MTGDALTADQAARLLASTGVVAGLLVALLVLLGVVAHRLRALERDGRRLTRRVQMLRRRQLEVIGTVAADLANVDADVADLAEGLLRLRGELRAEALRRLVAEANDTDGSTAPWVRAAPLFHPQQDRHVAHMSIVDIDRAGRARRLKTAGTPIFDDTYDWYVRQAQAGAVRPQIADRPASAQVTASGLGWPPC